MKNLFESMAQGLDSLDRDVDDSVFIDECDGFEYDDECDMDAEDCGRMKPIKEAGVKKKSLEEANINKSAISKSAAKSSKKALSKQKADAALRRLLGQTSASKSKTADAGINESIRSLKEDKSDDAMLATAKQVFKDTIGKDDNGYHLPGRFAQWYVYRGDFGDMSAAEIALLANELGYKVKKVPYGYDGDKDWVIGDFDWLRKYLLNDEDEKIDILTGEIVECAKPLTERKWNYTLKSGKALRQAIDDEDYEAVKECLIAAYKEINEAMPDIYDDLANDIGNLEVIDLNEDEINYALSEFYDLCDNLGIWVDMM